MIPLILAFTFAQELLALVPAPADREFATLLESDAGKAFSDGASAGGLILVMFLFNTMLGEEPCSAVSPSAHERRLRARRLGGERPLFAGYHLHVPWAIPGTLLDMFTIVYPTKRYRSAWIGIAVHSAEPVPRRYSSSRSSSENAPLPDHQSPANPPGSQGLAFGGSPAV